MRYPCFVPGLLFLALVGTPTFAKAEAPSEEKIACQAGTHQIFEPLTDKAELIGRANTLDRLYAVESLLNQIPFSQRGAYSPYQYYKTNLEQDLPSAEVRFRQLAGEKYGLWKYDLAFSRADVSALRQRLLDSGELQNGVDYRLACADDVVL